MIGQVIQHSENKRNKEFQMYGISTFQSSKDVHTVHVFQYFELYLSSTLIMLAGSR